MVGQMGWHKIWVLSCLVWEVRHHRLNEGFILQKCQLELSLQYLLKYPSHVWKLLYTYGQFQCADFSYCESITRHAGNLLWEHHMACWKFIVRASHGVLEIYCESITRRAGNSLWEHHMACWKFIVRASDGVLEIHCESITWRAGNSLWEHHKACWKFKLRPN